MKSKLALSQALERQALELLRCSEQHERDPSEESKTAAANRVARGPDRKIPACGALSGVGLPAALSGWLRRSHKGVGLTVLSTCASCVLDEAAPIVCASEFAADLLLCSRSARCAAFV